MSSSASARPLPRDAVGSGSLDGLQVGLQPFDGSAARSTPHPQVEYESRIADRAPSEARRRNMMIFQMLFDPLQQGHVPFAPTRKFLVFLLCS